MIKHKPFILASLLALFALVLACNFSFSTANIAETWMSADEEGNNRTTTFAPDAVFYAQVDLRNASDDTKLKAVWTAVNVEGAEPNTLINETETTSGSAVLHFTLSNSNPWPAGTYKVDIYLEDKLAKTLEFTVQ